MTGLGRRPFKCRCGRETWKPEVVGGVLLCPTCAFDAEYGVGAEINRRPDIRPQFSVKRVS